MIKGELFMNLIDMSTEGWTQEEVIEFRKLLNQQIKNARKESRHDACMLCGKKGAFVIHTQFRNFVLRILHGMEHLIRLIH